MRLQPIENAPLDGTAILVRCGNEPRDYHLVSYVGGAWMDIHGGYVLNEDETGPPTHFAFLPPDTGETKSDSRIDSEKRLSCTMPFLVAVALSVALGAVIENHFNVPPG